MVFLYPPIKAIIFAYGNVIARLDNTLFLTGIVQHSPPSVAEIQKVSLMNRISRANMKPVRALNESIDPRPATYTGR